MLSEKSRNGKGIDVSLEEGEAKEELLEQFVLAATREAFSAQDMKMPEDITQKTVARFVFAGQLQQGKAIVKPFWIQGVFVPLFIKTTDSPTKFMISPLNGLCPGVIKNMVREIIPEPMDPAPTIPIGLYPPSFH